MQETHNKLRGGKQTGGVFTAGELIKHFEQNKVHPKVIKKLVGAGWFDKLVSGINMATDFYNKNKDTIHQVGKAGVDLYKTLKGGKLTGGKLSAKQFLGWKRIDIVKHIMELKKLEYDRC